MRKTLYVGSLVLLLLTFQNVSADATNPDSIGFNGIGANSKEFGPVALSMLNKLAKDLTQRDDLVLVKIEGYTDAEGDPSYNLSLSQKRAEVVRDFLVDKGIPKEKLQALGSGAEHPIASNLSDEGRALNRRVEITIQYQNRKTASSN